MLHAAAGYFVFDNAPTSNDIMYIVCYFWWYSWLKCGFIHITWRNPILFCYMCIRFIIYVVVYQFIWWLVHFLFDLSTLTIYIIKRRVWYKYIISDTYEHHINIFYYPAYDFKVNDDWPVTHWAYFNYIFLFWM